MTEMVDNLLTLARADEGRAPLAVERVRPAGTGGRGGRDRGHPRRGHRHHGAHRGPEHAGARWRSIRSRIRQLLLNLVTNAIKYTPPGGKVSLGLVDQGDAVAIVVGDTGIGIAAGDLPHIFDRFWRADPARSRTGERPGAGLGLAITKWIAEAHGGTIAVQSRPGRGTVFTVHSARGQRDRHEGAADGRRASWSAGAFRNGQRSVIRLLSICHLAPACCIAAA